MHWQCIRGKDLWKFLCKEQPTRNFNEVLFVVVCAVLQFCICIQFFLRSGVWSKTKFLSKFLTVPLPCVVLVLLWLQFLLKCTKLLDTWDGRNDGRHIRSRLSTRRQWVQKIDEDSGCFCCSRVCNTDKRFLVE